MSMRDEEAGDILAELPRWAPSENDHVLEVPSIRPPSFAESQFDVILRRQRARTRHDGGLKLTASPSRFHNLSNAFEFAGWGTVSYLELPPEEYRQAESTAMKDNDRPLMGPWMASSVAANDIFGGVFYAFPPIVASAGIYSPISLLMATLSLFLWRPIIEDLTSAFPSSGSNYIYLINVTSKGIALVGGALTLLDYATTVVISASTASMYLAGEIVLPFPIYVGALIFLLIPLTISLLGLKESARTAFGIMVLHMSTMVVLMIAALVAWIRHGNTIIAANWSASQPGSSSGIARQIFDGLCLGILSMTGFECSPDYVTVVRPGKFPKVLRNIHYPTIGLYTLLMLLVLANIPLDVINSGSNVLSVLADEVAGRWMRIWLVVDASIILCAGVLTGILSACELCEKLAKDRVIPQAALKRIPATNSFGVSIISFALLSCALYVTTGANQQIMSSIFAMVWLSVMALFPISFILLKFNRGRIIHSRHASITLALFTLLVITGIFAGNVVIDSRSVGYFAAYAIAIFAFFFISNKKTRIIQWSYWLYDQTPLLHKWRWAHRKSDVLVKTLKRLRRQPVCVLARTDEIHHLFRMISYVSKNEETSCVKLVHFYDTIDNIPSEIEANAKLLDEAFPEITIDLIFFQAPFTPVTLAALAHKLGIPRALMFMSCPGSEFKTGTIAEYGTRIVAL